MGLLLLPLCTLSAEGRNLIPKGHYLSFARERNLQNEMVEPLADPDSVTDYRLKVAQDLEDAIETPGVQGLWMEFRWRDIEVADGKYDWSVMDANMAVARRYGREFIVNIADRTYDGSRIVPAYFPPGYEIEIETNNTNKMGVKGYTAKRWDPYVYNRLIRLYRAIADRYAEAPAFGGIATAETAVGGFSGGDYSLDKHLQAWTEIITQTGPALTRGRLFLYLNFLKNGMSIDMNQDARVDLLQRVPHDNLVIGGPDITPDVQGMPRSVTAYRIHVRKTMPSLQQFCHLQFFDQGKFHANVKSNEHRQEYLDDVATVRQREQQSWFSGTQAVFEFDDLTDDSENQVKLHPKAELGELWTPEELFEYGRRNFDCDYVMWHYRRHEPPGEFSWPDVRQVITRHQCFDPNGCTHEPQAPRMF